MRAQTLLDVSVIYLWGSILRNKEKINKIHCLEVKRQVETC